MQAYNSRRMQPGSRLGEAPQSAVQRLSSLSGCVTVTHGSVAPGVPDMSVANFGKSLPAITGSLWGSPPEVHGELEGGSAKGIVDC